MLQLGVQKVFLDAYLPAAKCFWEKQGWAEVSYEEYQDLVYNHHIWVNEDEPDPAQRELYRILHVLPSAAVLEDEARTMLPAPNNSILSMPATTNTTTPPPSLTSITTSLSS